MGRSQLWSTNKCDIAGVYKLVNNVSGHIKKKGKTFEDHKILTPNFMLLG